MAHFLVYNVLAKFQLFCIITCRDILYFVFWLPYCHTLWRHQYLICIIQKSWIYLEQDEKWQKGKRHSSSLLKAFQIRPFFNTSIFHFIGTLTSQPLCWWTKPPKHRNETTDVLMVSVVSSRCFGGFISVVPAAPVVSLRCFGFQHMPLMINPIFVYHVIVIILLPNRGNRTLLIVS